MDYDLNLEPCLSKTKPLNEPAPTHTKKKSFIALQNKLHLNK